MNIIVSNSLDVPLYIQIKEQIKEAILKGELEDGELLPSIRNFANDVHVSVLTIVSRGNPELLRDFKRRIIEQDLQKAVHNAKLFDIEKDELYAMVDIMYEED